LKKPKVKEYRLTHQQGQMSIEDAFPKGTNKDCDFGIQIARDGRVWICVNGKAFIRFKPNP